MISDTYVVEGCDTEIILEASGVFIFSRRTHWSSPSTLSHQHLLHCSSIKKFLLRQSQDPPPATLVLVVRTRWSWRWNQRILLLRRRPLIIRYYPHLYSIHRVSFESWWHGDEIRRDHTPTYSEKSSQYVRSFFTTSPSIIIWWFTFNHLQHQVCWLMSLISIPIATTRMRCNSLNNSTSSPPRTEQQGAKYF